MAKRRVSDRKVDTPRFDSRTVNASLCIWERRALRLFLIEAKQSDVVAQPDEKTLKQPEKVLCIGVVRQTQRAWFIGTNELDILKPQQHLFFLYVREVLLLGRPQKIFQERGNKNRASINY